MRRYLCIHTSSRPPNARGVNSWAGISVLIVFPCASLQRGGSLSAYESSLHHQCVPPGIANHARLLVTRGPGSCSKIQVWFAALERKRTNYPVGRATTTLCTKEQLRLTRQAPRWTFAFSSSHASVAATCERGLMNRNRITVLRNHACITIMSRGD